jgi:hypothetical protein
MGVPIGAGDIGAGDIAVGDPPGLAVGGLLGHGRFCAPASTADAATNARTRGRQLALMVRDSPSSDDTPPFMATIRYTAG